MSPSVESSRKSYPCGIGDCKCVEVSEKDLAEHLRKLHGHGIDFFWKCPNGGPKCDTTKLWLWKGSFKTHLRGIHGIEPDNDYMSRCIDSPDRRSPPPLLAHPGPFQKPPVKQPPVKKPPVEKPPVKRLLPKEVQPQGKLLQEEKAKERSHQGLPAGWLGIQEAVPHWTPPMFNMAHAGPSKELVRTQGLVLQNLMPGGKPPLQSLLYRSPIQEEPAQEHVHQRLPAGRQELQESVPHWIFNTAQAGPSRKRVRTQGPALQNLMPGGEPPLQGLLPRTPPMSNVAHARPSPNPPPWEPLREESPQGQFCHRMQAEHAAMGMSIRTSTLPIAEVTRARASQGVLLQDEPWEAFLQETSNYGPLAPSLPEGLHTGLPQKVLFGEKQFEGAQSQEQPPPEPPARWGTIPKSSTTSTIASSTADGQYVAAHNQTADDHISPDSAGSSIYDPHKPGRHQRQG